MKRDDRELHHYVDRTCIVIGVSSALALLSSKSWVWMIFHVRSRCSIIGVRKPSFYFYLKFQHRCVVHIRFRWKMIIFNKSYFEQAYERYLFRCEMRHLIELILLLSTRSSNSFFFDCPPMNSLHRHSTLMKKAVQLKFISIRQKKIQTFVSSSRVERFFLFTSLDELLLRECLHFHYKKWHRVVSE